jgi:hypothetical protein
LSNTQTDEESHNISRLMQTLRLVTDPRKPRGKVHELACVLATSTVAVLAGARTFREVARRVNDLPGQLLKRLGAVFDHFTGRYLAPSESTIRRVLQSIDADRLDAAVGAWLYERARRDHDDDRLVIALDGKVLRGAWTSTNDQVTLFSAMIHNEGVVVAQTRVPDATNEITQVEQLLENLPAPAGDTVVTVDAAHTQHDTARHLKGERDLDYVMTVKGNQPTLQKRVFDTCLPLLGTSAQHTVQERSHGRIRRWSTWITNAEGIDFPHIEQVAAIRREEFGLDGIRTSKEYALIATSLTPAKAGAADLHTYVRGHWGIENKVHYVRDTTWREDNHQAWVGNGPRTMATLRNLALGLFRINGIRKIKEATEYIAADRTRALPLLAT